ncbi:hypothetical protein PC129_g20741 [Phytophthora cactorum]|uniref:Uncharacterized protein n=1 Tax=Phytophthora cactorum TaxID=29920 RepID=A0A329T4Q7_9STRA|nr:hypothetical protein Pcac1_g2586 [Phytophthora cactorum]KAG2797916.1 hypothetical protein PC111_g21079 [Phytophthora cactorum]KAG2837782.1 hypothetical protein PC112_g4769 [Phytophthora cactorum]KAG2869155.1 hypothetical protein PC113_g407 [Phytophthora cactorum]KAG2893939.1 hypothetical protein PC117_g23650 [Phytophthora cactorum]
MRTHPVFYAGVLKPYQDSAHVSVETLAPGWLNPRVASHSDLLVLEQRIHSLNANSNVHLLVVDLDEIPGWVDSFESPSALQSLAADVERQVAQLQGQLDLLLHFQQYAPRPVGPPPAVDRPRRLKTAMDIKK